MDIRDQLQDLETTAQLISDGLDAIQVMVIGLDSTGDQYAGALSAIWSYLSQTNQALKAQLTSCLNTI